MSLTTPEKLQKLQQALHAKAKGSPDHRFHALYDKVYRTDVLAFAYRCCRANGGAPGVDGQTFDAIESYGVETWLSELAEELATKRYRPLPVRRVMIPKENGKLRPLGIPTIKDRVVQKAVVLLLEPILEADLPPEQFAYRAGRNASHAVTAVVKLLRSGHTEVIDADLSEYFESIPHAELMQCIARRIVDGSLLHLIKMWLVVPVEENDEQGRTTRTTRNRDIGRGVPQGSPLSPLLSNWYMRRFVWGWRTLGHEKRLNARIVNYADDFVICCKSTGAQAMAAMRDMMQRLKLTINEQKTRHCVLPGNSFHFLGFEFGLMYSRRNGFAYWGVRARKERVQGVCRQVHDLTSAQTTYYGVEDRVARLNELLEGWANYFSLGTVSRVYNMIDHYTVRRLRQWLRRKHLVKRGSYLRWSYDYFYKTLGLVCLAKRRGRLPWAEA
ncbi:MAG: group II intron reverse transcriptase/maturase [Gemmatales bacterium]